MKTEFMLLSIYNRPRIGFKEVCEAIGIAPQTGYNLRSGKRFPVKLSGNPLTADIRDVAAHLDSLRSDTESDTNTQQTH